MYFFKPQTFQTFQTFKLFKHFKHFKRSNIQTFKLWRGALFWAYFFDCALKVWRFENTKGLKVWKFSSVERFECLTVWNDGPQKMSDIFVGHFCPTFLSDIFVGHFQTFKLSISNIQTFKNQDVLKPPNFQTFQCGQTFKPSNIGTSFSNLQTFQTFKPF